MENKSAAGFLSGWLGLAALAGCTQAAEGPADNFASGSQALALSAAPPGLCLGGGAQRECEDSATCEAGRGGASGEFGAQPGGQAPSAAGGQSFAAGTGGVLSAAAAGGQTSFAPPTAGQLGTDLDGLIDGDEPAPPPQDAGCEAAMDAGACDAQDAGQSNVDPDAVDVAASAFALGGSCSGLSQQAPATLFLSADDSNSTASATIARRMIRNGQAVPASLIRPYEFLNYYDFDFEPAAPGEVRIVPQLSSCPTNGELSFQVALQSEARDPAHRAPLNLTFVLDTSGSMGGQPIALEKAAVLAVASALRAGDIVSMVTWSVTQDSVLSGHVVTGPNDPVVVAAANGIEAGGGTNLSGGLKWGYEAALANRSPGRINRLILISDGQANMGVTDEKLIAQYADAAGEHGHIYLAGIGVGDGVRDTLMDAVTDVGRGAYVYLDSVQEAEKMLGERLLETVDVAARDVRLQLDLPWYLGVEKFYGEAISTDASEVRPQHLAPNSAMLFFQVLKACDASLLHGDDRIRMTATWVTPFEREARQVTIDTTLNQLAGDDRELTKAAAIAGYAEALSASAKAETNAQAVSILLTALADVRAASNAGTDPDLLEVADLLVAYLGRHGHIVQADANGG